MVTLRFTERSLCAGCCSEALRLCYLIPEAVGTPEAGVCSPLVQTGRCSVAPVNLRSETQVGPEKADGQSRRLPGQALCSVLLPVLVGEHPGADVSMDEGAVRGPSWTRCCLRTLTSRGASLAGSPRGVGPGGSFCRAAWDGGAGLRPEQ